VEDFDFFRESVLGWGRNEMKEVRYGYGYGYGYEQTRSDAADRCQMLPETDPLVGHGDRREIMTTGRTI